MYKTVRFTIETSEPTPPSSNEVAIDSYHAILYLDSHLEDSDVGLSCRVERFHGDDLPFMRCSNWARRCPRRPVICHSHKAGGSLCLPDTPESPDGHGGDRTARRPRDANVVLETEIVSRTVGGDRANVDDARLGERMERRPVLHDVVFNPWRALDPTIDGEVGLGVGGRAGDDGPSALVLHRT